MKKLSFLTLLISINLSTFSQKIVLNTGLRYRVTPIYIEGVKSFYQSYKNILIQEDQHLRGLSLINEVEYKFKKISLSYTLGLRIDIAESKIENTSITTAKSKLFVDHILAINYLIISKKERELIFSLGLSLNNLNSDYTYTTKEDQGNGIILISSASSNFVFQSLNFNITKNVNRYKFSMGCEYVYKHKFFQPSELLIPTISIKYLIAHSKIKEQISTTILLPTYGFVQVWRSE